MSEWKDLLDRAGISIDSLKAKLPLQFVVEQAGVPLEVSQDRLIGPCPFHDDDAPSFALFGENLEKCGCWSCDFQIGDLLDFIQRWKDLPFTEALSFATSLLKQYEAGTWVPSARPEPAPEDPLAFERFGSEARQAWSRAAQDDSAIVRFLYLKGLPIEASFLVWNWYVGTGMQGELVVPHLAPDKVVLGVKTRQPDTHLFARRGTKLRHLYGCWRDQKRRTVVLCEGESDAWWVSWVLHREQESWDVLALPSGANAAIQEEWRESLKGRNVILCFDGDRAGRMAAKRWAKDLHETAERVSVARLPDGKDAANLSHRELLTRLHNAEPVTPFVGPVVAGPRSYLRTSSGADITDWVFTPDRYLMFPGGEYGFEGWVNGRHAVITVSDLRSEGSARDWSNRHGGVWWGTVKDAQAILKLLLTERPFLTESKGTRKVGWHDGSFVTPTETFGSESYVYTPGAATREFERIVTLAQPQGEIGAMARDLLSLHSRDVISPIIAWVCSAVMRSQFRVFPPLAVVGGSGVGKTTLVDAILTAFGFGGGEQNLSSTTRYGIGTLVSGSCGVPVWLDEYRPGARKDTLEAVQQILRDAWTGSVSLRGGMGNNWSEVWSFETSAPILISGEDMFSETSHLERIVIVRVPQDTTRRSPEALVRLRSAGQLGRSYLAWITGMAESGELTPPDVGGMTRPQAAEAILDFGWYLFRRFCAELGAVDVGDLSLDGVRELRSRAQVDPVIDLVLWGLGEQDRQLKPLAWEREEGVFVRLRELVKHAREHDVALPGGERAISDWLIERFGGMRARTEYGMALYLPNVTAQSMLPANTHISSPANRPWG